MPDPIGVVAPAVHAGLWEMDVVASVALAIRYPCEHERQVVASYAYAVWKMRDAIPGMASEDSS